MVRRPASGRKAGRSQIQTTESLERERLSGMDSSVFAELATGEFSFIYRNSRQEEIDVNRCIPLFKSRKLCESAVRMFIKAFDADELRGVRYSAAGGLKIVVEIPSEELGLVQDFLQTQGKTEDEARTLAYDSELRWYGVVDGRHIHSALVRLGFVRPDRFQDFKWTVIVIEWQPISILKAFARARNMLQSAQVVEMTHFDTLSAIHEIVQEKARISGDTVDSIMKERGSKSRVADEFGGGSGYAKETTRTLVGAAFRIKSEKLEVLGRTMHEENPSMARRVLAKERNEVVRDEDVFDARVYKNLISTNTVRGATKFLNANAEDQSHVLLRMKSAFEQNNFKCFQASRLNKETESSTKVRHQVNLMKDLMGREKWPEELSVVERKLVLSSHLDTELDESKVSENKILASLVKEYKERMPLEAGLRWRMYCRERGIRDDTGEGGSQVPPSFDEADQQTQQQGQQQRRQQEGDEPLHDEAPAPECCALDTLNITCMDLGLEKFSMERKAEDKKFHLVTGDPTQLQLNGTCKVIFDEQQADRVIKRLKPMLHDHGWIFLYTRAVYYRMWDKAFRANDFDSLAYPWPMIRNTETVQCNTSPIPQSVMELLIGARKKDSGRPDFQPDTTSSIKRDVYSRKRKFAIFDNCPEPRMKLKKPNTRQPVRSKQRSAEPMDEFMDTFCPP